MGYDAVLFREYVNIGGYLPKLALRRADPQAKESYRLKLNERFSNALRSKCVK
jgi:hypothetical protein